MIRRGTKIMGGTQEFAQDMNIFERHEEMLRLNQPQDKERPRANLYNVIKKLRENSVSVSAVIILICLYRRALNTQCWLPRSTTWR